VLAAFVATMVTNLMIQLASAMIGASLIVLSALYFTTGETIHKAILEDDDWTLILDMDLYVAAAALGLGLIGFLVQRRGAK
jgi:predicted metal-dependent HD superfamily phosphohydrolase